MVQLQDGVIYDEGSFSNTFEMVLLTSIICIALTWTTLLFMCHFYPPSELELLLDATSISTLIRSLQANRNSLEKVSVKGFELYRENELLPLFQELAKLPRLLACSVELVLPVKVLTYLLERATKLQDLSVYFQLVGTEDDLKQLAASVRRHTTLTKVAIETFEYKSTSDRQVLLDPLIQALSHLPTLTTLSIHNLHSSPFAFSTLLESQHITTLELSSTPLLSAIQVGYLQRNETLRSLSAPLYYGTEDAWGDMIKKNNAIQRLSLILERAPPAWANQECNDSNAYDVFLPITKALVESSCRELVLGVNENMFGSCVHKVGLSAVSLQAMARSLHRNDTLKSITIGQCRESLTPDTPMVQALKEAIKHNYTLESFEITSTSSTIFRHSEINFFLTCNSMGRKSIIKASSPSCAALVQFILKAHMDVSAIFHVLSEKPEMIYTTPQRGTSGQKDDPT